MYFKLVYDKSLIQASYVIGRQKTGIATVIDPKRDVDTYLKIARENNFKITHIQETDIHADFLCDSRKLSAITKGELDLSDEGNKGWKYEFPHNEGKHGDIIKIEEIAIQALHTPRHTPEHLSFLPTDDKAAKEKEVVLCYGNSGGCSDWFNHVNI